MKESDSDAGPDVLQVRRVGDWKKASLAPDHRKRNEISVGCSAANDSAGRALVDGPAAIGNLHRRGRSCV